MKQHQCFLVIMAGGIGSRFYPFSRENFPKQFQDILGRGQSLLQESHARLASIVEDTFVVTNQSYKDLVNQQLPLLSDQNILLEPSMRNTAPCIAYAAYKIAKKYPHANILVTPADHLIDDTKAFQHAIRQGLDFTKQNNAILTIGIKPSRPDTGYGYIRMHQSKTKENIHPVVEFAEKPNYEKALKYLDSGEYLWNAGIFVWNVQTIIASFRKYLPEMANLFEEAIPDFYTENESASIAKIYEKCEKISIDYGIMEKADNVYVLPSDCGWSDLGTWKSLFEASDKNTAQNVINANALVYESSNCIIKAPKDKLVIVQGLEDYIVAEFDNVILVCRKDEEQRIKEFLHDVKATQNGKFI